MEVMRTVVNGEHLQCGKYKFEHVKELSYLDPQLNQTNSTNSGIHARILSGNRCYYSCGKLIESRALNRNLKLKIYKSLIRPVVTYGCEAWILTTRDEQHLRIFFFFIFLLNYCQFKIYSLSVGAISKCVESMGHVGRSHSPMTLRQNARLGESSVQDQLPTAV
jgi:hypothetical protein